jgi:UDPglucose 6-dehydrogenase
MHINEDQRQRFLRKVRTALWTLRGKRLAVLGLAFKGGTDDIRESPAILLVQALLQEGCQICAYDPAAMPRAREVLNGHVEFATNAYDAAAGADALLILTEWEEFASLDLTQLATKLHYPIVIDGRNLYEPDVMAAHGFTYYSVGRAPVLAEGLNSQRTPQSNGIAKKA